MVTNEEIERINFLYKKSKLEELNDDEKKEQKELRNKYIEWIKSQVKSQLETVTIKKED